MKRFLLLTSFLLSLFRCAFSQEYSYTHYDISEGLAGSTVYCITQDKDGFIWTGTETGVSRFDGTHFYNFTTIDGLPDVEILEMFGDSKGRVWMAPFSKSICYYYKGRIYNKDNDSLLRHLRLKGNIEHFAEDRDGNILVQERTALHLFTTNGSIIEYDSIANQPIRNCGAISRSLTGHFLVQVDKEIYNLDDNRFLPLCTIPFESVLPGFIAMSPGGMIWRAARSRTEIRSFATGKVVILPFEMVHFRHNTFSIIDDSLYYFNEFSGATEYNQHTGLTRSFLPGKQVSRTFRDATGNTWFTTLGQGIYRLNSDEFQTIRLNAPGMEVSSIYAIKRIGDRLLVGDNHNYLFDFSLPDLVLRKKVTLTAVSKNRILNISRMHNGMYLIASDRGLEECTPEFRIRQLKNMGLKSIFEVSRDKLLLSAFWGVGLFDLHNFRLIDTLWRDRATTVYYRRDTTYIGTLNGLYAVTLNRSVVFLGKNIPFLQKRISAIAESSDSTLWIATYDAGVIGYKNGQVTASFSKKRGLTSDICRTLFIYDNNLWIGTDKGLNKISLNKPGYPVSKYTSQDGLGSDIVNSLFAYNTVIYVGTPAGLSYFDETKVDRSEGCLLYLLSVVNSGKERISDTASLLLPYTDKHIRLEYAGISYRSVGGLIYRYRLLGLDSGWRTTPETFLEYPTLPSGKYELQLQAINKFGTRSAPLSLHFTVIAPFWQTIWFSGLIIAFFFFLTWLFVSLRIRYIRRRQLEKELLNQRIIEMEHMALQAQMNPHFIFNCLNSIQQYIFDQDIYAANKYISGFAKLIRATLQNSSKPFIGLPDEISYLSGYLSLEKLRFKEKMDYLIEADPSINDEIHIIPPMLIQPFVENSMRHGLRHKLEGKGFITIKFWKAGDRLAVTIEDNGIGRKKAGSFKTREHIEYQSKGMSLTADRIRMMNAKYKDNILIDVIDLEDPVTGNPTGTRVIMEFPLFHILLENQAI
jgi:ligand-binding sensor domain-containing protein